MQLSTRQVFVFASPALLAICLGMLIPFWLIVETGMGPGWTFAGIKAAFNSALLSRVLIVTLEISITASIVSVVLALPVALHLSRQPPGLRTVLSMLVLLPFWTSILVKSYAFIVLFGNDSLLNWIYTNILGIKGGLLFNRVGVVVAMVHYLLPFCVFPILSNLVGQNPDLPKVARAMGAGPLRILFRIKIPLAMPAIASAFGMSVVLSLGMYITPALLGGRKDLMLANLIDFYTRETLNWPFAAVIALLLVLMAGSLFGALHNFGKR